MCHIRPVSSHTVDTHLARDGFRFLPVARANMGPCAVSTDTFLTSSSAMEQTVAICTLSERKVILNLSCCVVDYDTPFLDKRRAYVFIYLQDDEEFPVFIIWSVLARWVEVNHFYMSQTVAVVEKINGVFKSIFRDVAPQDCRACDARGQ